MVIDRQVGRGAVLDEAINEALPQLYVEALQDNDLQPLAQPEIEVTKLEDNETLEFTAEVDVRPEITLPDYDGLEAERRRRRRHRRGRRGAGRRRCASASRTLTDVERAAADGDFVVIDLVATKDGEAVEGAEVSGMSYQVGRGGMLDGLDEALAGMTAGDEKTFTSAARRRRPGRRGRRGRRSRSPPVKEQELPELDDEFAQTASEFDTVDELTDDVRDAARRAASASSRPPPPATPSSRSCSTWSTSRCPRPSSTDELNARREHDRAAARATPA